MDVNSTVAASRLIAQERAMDVVANNLANANTPGFKLERVQFSDWLSRQTGATTPPGGNTVAFTQDRATWRDQSPGTLTQTGNAFDLALAGDGFFTVNTPRGPRLTRDGRFGPMPDGTLADGSGNAVLDTNGKPIQIPPTVTEASVAGDGTISTPNGQLGKVGVVQPANLQLLQPEGGTLFTTTSATSAVATPKIVQGALEESNVQPILEMTRMMNDAREFQFVSQYIQAESDRQQGAIDKLLPLK